MGRKHKHPEHINHERWMVSFADFMTLLFALFVVLFAVSQVDERKYQQLASSMEKAFGVLPNHASGLEEEDPGGTKSLIPPVMLFQAMEDSKQQQREQEKKLADKINKEFSKEGVALRKDERGLIIQLKDSQFFESGSANILPRAVPVLKKLTREIEKMRRAMRIEGHTDNIPLRGGRYGSNWELSAARAGSVLHFLLNNSKIPPVNMSMAGYAEFRPIASNATPAGRSRNRRVDIVLMNAQTTKSEEPSASRNHTQLSDTLNKELESRLLSGARKTEENPAAPGHGASAPVTERAVGEHSTAAEHTAPAPATERTAGEHSTASEHAAPVQGTTPAEHRTPPAAGHAASTTEHTAPQHTSVRSVPVQSAGGSLEKQLESKISGQPEHATGKKHE